MSARRWLIITFAFGSLSLIGKRQCVVRTLFFVAQKTQGEPSGFNSFNSSAFPSGGLKAPRRISAMINSPTT